jgi:hypothetical protein
MNRPRYLKIRVSDEELDGIRARATEAGMTVSDLIRLRLLNSRLRQNGNDRERIRHLARIGSNLNQLARWANTYKLKAQTVEVVLWLNRLLVEARHLAEGEGHAD